MARRRRIAPIDVLLINLLDCCFDKFQKRINPEEKSTMRQSSKCSAFVLVAVALLAVVGTIPSSHGQTQDKAPRPASSRVEETLEMWNQTGNKLIAMAQDFPEAKYDFKVQKDQRTFAENILHVPHSTTSWPPRFPDRRSGPTSANTEIIRHARHTRRRPTW